MNSADLLNEIAGATVLSSRGCSTYNPEGSRFPMKKQTSERKKAIKLLRRILQDGQWWPRSVLEAVIVSIGVNPGKNTSLPFMGILTEIGCAESDSGWFYCIPGESTPTLAPDDFTFFQERKMPIPEEYWKEAARITRLKLHKVKYLSNRQ